MGTINYHTSKYITLGEKPFDFETVKAESFDAPDVSDEEVYDLINTNYEDDFENAELLLDRYNFEYFDLDLEYGYYEGFYLDLDTNFEFYSEDDRNDALKELNELKDLLVDLAGYGMVSCTPGWSTGYASFDETIKDIDRAIEDIKKDIKDAPLVEANLKCASSVNESDSNEKWREMTYIEDYEFDPDGKYDGALYAEQWDEIFNDLYQRAETTEEWRDNPWVDPVSTRNAYTGRFNRNGTAYIVLKYYDGPYALYEIDPDHVDESVNYHRKFVECIDAGISIRQAIVEAKKVFEDVAGMNREVADKLMADMNSWTGGSGKGGWVYQLIQPSGGTYVVSVKSNPIHDFKAPVSLDISAGNILNGEVYHPGQDAYLSATGPVSFSGLKSVIRDLVSQWEMSDDTLVSDMEGNSGDIYGY